MPFISLTCHTCKKSFLGPSYENQSYNPTYRFCSRKCSNIHNGPIIAAMDIQLTPNSPILYIMAGIHRNIKMCPRLGPTNITFEYLWEVWNKQQGKCALSGRQIKLPKSINHLNDFPRSQRASLDRINSRVPYTTGNVQFVTIMANQLKSNMSLDDFYTICAAIHNTSIGIQIKSPIYPPRTKKIRQCIHPLELRPFVIFLRNAEKRTTKYGYPPVNITLQHLKSIWDHQRGICLLTGWNLCLPDGVTGWTHELKSVPTQYRASLDRINHDQGYTMTNVRFVSAIANMGRNGETDQVLIQFCHDVCNFNHIQPAECSASLACT